MTFLSKLSSVSSITSFLSPPPLSRLCKKQTDPHLRNNQNSSPTQAISCVSCCTKLSLFEWGTEQAVSVRSQNFPILELTIHTAYSHSTFKKQQVNLLLIIRKKKKEIRSNWLTKCGSTSPVPHALICLKTEYSPIFQSHCGLVSRRNKHLGVQYTLQHTVHPGLSGQLEMSVCTCSVIQVQQ